MTKTDLTVREPEKAVKVRTILILYRDKVKSHQFEAHNDTWMVLTLKNAHYGVCGRSLDLIMLMDGITQEEFKREPAYVSLCPALKSDGIILEAG